MVRKINATTPDPIKLTNEATSKTQNHEKLRKTEKNPIDEISGEEYANLRKIYEKNEKSESRIKETIMYEKKRTYTLPKNRPPWFVK